MPRFDRIAEDLAATSRQDRISLDERFVALFLPESPLDRVESQELRQIVLHALQELTPTEMKVVNAHKGCCAIRTIVTGLEGHSSETHKGVNSIFAAAKLISYLADRAEALQTSNVNPRFDPPYTTIQVGVINGGTQVTSSPRKLHFGGNTAPYRMWTAPPSSPSSRISPLRTCCPICRRCTRTRIFK